MQAASQKQLKASPKFMWPFKAGREVVAFYSSASGSSTTAETEFISSGWSREIVGRKWALETFWQKERFEMKFPIDIFWGFRLSVQVWPNSRLILKCKMSPAICWSAIAAVTHYSAGHTQCRLRCNLLRNAPDSHIITLLEQLKISNKYQKGKIFTTNSDIFPETYSVNKPSLASFTLWGSQTFTFQAEPSNPAWTWLCHFDSSTQPENLCHRWAGL